MLLKKESGLVLDTKAIGDDGSFEGYGSIFGNVDSYGEVVDAGAFKGSLADAKRQGRTIKMLWQHDPEQPIGVWDELTEDGKGLKAKGRFLINVSAKAREAHGLVKEGALDGMSIGYRIIESSPDKVAPGVYHLKKIDLREISIVTFAANGDARVESIKSEAAQAVYRKLVAGDLPTEREWDSFFKQTLEMSNAQAERATALIKASSRGDREQADHSAKAALDEFRAAASGFLSTAS